MGAVVQRRKWASTRLPELPVGSYRLHIEPEDSVFEVKLRMTAFGGLVASDDHPNEFAVVAPGRLWLGVRPMVETKSGEALHDRLSLENRKCFRGKG